MAEPKIVLAVGGSELPRMTVAELREMLRSQPGLREAAHIWDEKGQAWTPLAEVVPATPAAAAVSQRAVASANAGGPSQPARLLTRPVQTSVWRLVVGAVASAFVGALVGGSGVALATRLDATDQQIVAPVLTVAPQDDAGEDSGDGPDSPATGQAATDTSPDDDGSTGVEGEPDDDATPAGPWWKQRALDISARCDRYHRKVYRLKKGINRATISGRGDPSRAIAALHNYVGGSGGRTVAKFTRDLRKLFNDMRRRGVGAGDVRWVALRTDKYCDGSGRYPANPR